MSQPGIEPVTAQSPERTLYQLSYRGRSVETVKMTVKIGDAENGYRGSRSVQFAFFLLFIAVELDLKLT